MRRTAILAVAMALAAGLTPAAAALSDGRTASRLTFTETSTWPIPDNNATGIFSEVWVFDHGQILDLNVSVKLSHTRVSDLAITLTQFGGAGTTITLTHRPGIPGGGCAGDDINVTFDDEASQAAETMCFGSAPAIRGAAQPDESLSAFDGVDMFGAWRFTVKDRVAGETGDLKEISVHVNVEYCNGEVATIVGTSGNDVLIGGSGNDVIVGREGADTINGGDGADIICGNKGSDTIDGGRGQDTLFGGAGDDTLAGGDGQDALFGEAGRDRLIGGEGIDDLSGGDATDTADYSTSTGAVSVDLFSGTALGAAGTDTLTAIENVDGSPFGDFLSGQAGPNTLRGLGGNDTLQGRHGDDTLIGGPGTDTAQGGPGADTCNAETETGCES